MKFKASESVLDFWQGFGAYCLICFTKLFEVW